MLSKHATISYKSGVILVVFAGIFWSTMGLGIRYIETANVWQILLYRSSALVPFLFFVISIRSRTSPILIIKKSGFAAIIGGLGLVVAFTGGISAIQSTSVANAMFLFAAAPFLTAILGWPILKEGVRNITWICIIFAMSGVLIMVWHSIYLGQLLGNLLALLSALGFSVFTIALRWKKSEDMMPTVLLAGIFAIIISSFVCYFLGYDFIIPLSDAKIAICLGVFQVGAGLTIYTIGSKAVPAAELALLSMTEVVFGPLWVWLFLGEEATILTLFGGSILISAIFVNALTGNRKN